MQLDSLLLWLLVLCCSYGPASAISAGESLQHAATSTDVSLLGTDTADPATTTLYITGAYQTESSTIQTEVGAVSSAANPAASLKQSIQSTATPRNDPTSVSRVVVGTASTLLAHAPAGTSAVHTYPGGYGEDEATTYFSSDIVAFNTLVLPGSLSPASPSLSLTDNKQIFIATTSPTPDENYLATTASNEMSATRTGPVPEATEPPNALAVLYSALPSDVASSIASELNIDTILLYDTPSTTSQLTSWTTDTSSSSITSSLISSSTITNTVSSSTFSTITRPTSTTSSFPSATSTDAPATSSSTQLRQGSIAAIATGVAAGAVLVILTALLLLRWRQQGKPLFGTLARTGSVRSNRAYPEIAWLYDPVPAPQRTSQHDHRGDSEMTLLPTTYEGAAGVAGGGMLRGSPDLRPPDQDSPLLPPQIPLARSDSPGGSGGSSPRSGRGRSARSSLQSVIRMGAIHEEPRIH